MTHLTRDVLLAWRDAPTDALRAQVVPHLAACQRCSALFAELIRTASAAGEPERFNPAEFVSRGLAAGGPAAGEVKRRSAWPLVALAAAAVVVLAVFVARQAGNSTADSPPVVRGGESLRAVAPAGEVDGVPEFVWDSPGDAPSYRIEIVDGTGGPIYEARVSGARRLTLPPAIAARLMPGLDYRWSVSRLDARGDIADSSPLQSFRIRR